MFMNTYNGMTRVATSLNMTFGRSFDLYQASQSRVFCIGNAENQSETPGCAPGSHLGAPANRPVLCRRVHPMRAEFDKIGKICEQVGMQFLRPDLLQPGQDL